MKRLMGLATVTLSLSLVLLQAQQSSPQQFPADDDGDAPDHGVARISLVNGNVSALHGNSDDLVAAQINAPLVATDRVITGDASRAEVQFDAENMVRLAPMTEVRMGELQYHRYLVQVAQGTVTFRVLRQNDAQVEISTPNASVQPLRPGTYRVSVFGDGTSEITVRDGEADVFSPTGSEPLRAGTTMMSRGLANDPEFRTTAAINLDDWDRWNADRDRAFDHMNDSSRYVSPDVYGTEELSNNGRWANDPQYGQVWIPNADPDWAPYRNGRWSYIDYYGWSWVSYDPWGWAPYHYGRWYQGPYGWAWYPGPVAARNYWRPALVGFFGWGSPGFGTTMSFGFGNVGWVPLAPYERFRPWYGRNVYGNRLNMVNNTNIVNVFHNARFNGAVSSLRAGDFGRVPVNNRTFVRAGDRDLSRGGMVNGALGFGPTRESRQFAASNINARGLPAPNFTANRGTRFFSPSTSGFVGGQDRGGWRKFNDQNGGAARSDWGAERPRGRSNIRGDAFSGRDQQPVQVRPPIVTDRDGFAGERREQRLFPDGFGGARSNPGDGGGVDQRRTQQGGGFEQRRIPPPNAPGFGGPGAEPRRLAPNSPQGNSRPQPGGPGGGFRGPAPAPNGGGGFRGGMRGPGGDRGPRGGPSWGGGNPRGGGNGNGGNRGGGGGRSRGN